MVAIIKEVDQRTNNKFVVYYDGSFGSDYLGVYAKDELDAYTKATVYLTAREKSMRIVISCITGVIALIIIALTYAGTQNRGDLAAFRTACLDHNKSIVSENQGYSCR